MWLATARVVAAVAGGVLLVIVLRAGPAVHLATGAGYAALALVVVSEIFGRMLFYATERPAGAGLTADLLYSGTTILGREDLAPDSEPYRGRNSSVVSRRRSVRKPRTNLADPGVGCLIA